MHEYSNHCEAGPSPDSLIELFPLVAAVSGSFRKSGQRLTKASAAASPIDDRQELKLTEGTTLFNVPDGCVNQRNGIAPLRLLIQKSVQSNIV